MKIAIVILNWNGKALLEQFLPSVVMHSQGIADIYVADNASTDDSIAFVEATFPTVKIVRNDINGGFAKGYNDALKHIDADVFCLLNNDVEVTKDWLIPVRTVFETQATTAIVQPKILDYKQKDHFEYAGAGGGYIDKYGYPYCRGRIFNSIEKDEGQYNDIQDITWASGACLFIRKPVFEELLGFDEAFFAHMEEIDLCWRARNAGYNIQYVGASTIYHVGGATLSSANPKKTYLNFRNSLYCLAKNAPSPLFPLIFFRLILDGVAGVKFFIELKFRHVWAIIRSHFSFYSHLGTLLKQRKSLPKTKKYYHKTSVVWLYFVKQRKAFNRL